MSGSAGPAAVPVPPVSAGATSPARSGGSPRQLPRHERSAQILRAAARAFARAGYAATSMEDVAAEAGVTRLIVYRHYPSKEDLYRAVLEAVDARLAEEVQRRLAGPEPRAVITRSLLAVARDDPDGFRLLWVHAAREPDFATYAAQHHRRAVDHTEQLIAPAFSDPVVRRWAAGVLVDHAVSAVLRWVDEGAPERDEEMCLRVAAGLSALVAAWASAPPGGAGTGPADGGAEGAPKTPGDPR